MYISEERVRQPLFLSCKEGYQIFLENCLSQFTAYGSHQQFYVDGKGQEHHSILFVTFLIHIHSPFSWSVYKLWQSFRILSFNDNDAESLGFADPRCFTFPDISRALQSFTTVSYPKVRFRWMNVCASRKLQKKKGLECTCMIRRLLSRLMYDYRRFNFQLHLNPTLKETFKWEKLKDGNMQLYMG